MSRTTPPNSRTSETPSQSSLRRVARAAREAMSDEERDWASEVIAKKVISAGWFRSADVMSCYLATRTEVATWQIIRRAWLMGKRVYAPVVGSNHTMSFRRLTPDSELRRNTFGLLEPVDGDEISAHDLDLVVTPLVAFDAKRNRIGMGGGYFDRTFSFLRTRNLWLHPKLVGLAFSCQSVDKIARNPWDVRVFRVIDDKTQSLS